MSLSLLSSFMSLKSLSVPGCIIITMPVVSNDFVPMRIVKSSSSPGTVAKMTALYSPSVCTCAPGASRLYVSFILKAVPTSSSMLFFM